MAQISVSLAELIDLVIANNIMPDQISNIEPQGESLNFEFRTGLFFPKYVQIYVNVLEFEKGILVLELITDWFAEKLMKLLPFKNNEFLEYDFPRIIINLQTLLNKYIKGLKIDRIEYKNSRFNILTKTY